LQLYDDFACIGPDEFQSDLSKNSRIAAIREKFETQLAQIMLQRRHIPENEGLILDVLDGFVHAHYAFLSFTDANGMNRELLNLKRMFELLGDRAFEGPQYVSIKVSS
jgi:hypothetical protein